MWDKEKKKHIRDHELKPESLMMGYGYRPEWSEGAAKPPIFQTSTFVFASAEEGKAFFEVAYGLREKSPGETPGLIYSRLNNPGLEIIEDRLTLWDGAEAAAVFESGMAAISTTIFTFLRPGDVVAFPEPIYGGTEYLFHKTLPQFGIEPVCFPALEGVAGLERALAEGDRNQRLRMIYVETPANPTNALMDIEACVALARSLAVRPAILLFDEPFTGLDQVAAATLSRQLLRLRQEKRTCVLVTHRLDEAVGLIDHLVLLRRGRIRHQQAWTSGSLEELGALYTAYLDEPT